MSHPRPSAGGGALVNITESSSVGNVSLIANTGRTLTLSTLDGNNNIILSPHGTGIISASKALQVPDDVYDESSWSGNLSVPTKNAIRDKIESLGSGGGATLGANTFTDLQTITQASVNAGILASTGYSLTGSNAMSMIDLAGTWNTTGAPTAIKLNIINTASDAASLLLDLQVDGTTKFRIKKDGTGFSRGFEGGDYVSGGEIVTLSSFIFNSNRNTIAGGGGPGIFLFDYGNGPGTVCQIRLAGTTSAFPSLKRNGARIDIRLADDSAFAELVFLLPTSNPGVGTLWNNGGTLTVGT